MLARHPRIGRLVLLLGAALVALAAAELVLRSLGHRPGFVPRHAGVFQEVDELEELGQFFADERGVFRADPSYAWPPDTRVNAAGFRSIPFAPVEGEQTSVLFLGDSFTWGASATPLTESFVDRIAREGLVCFNAGMPGTNPLHYAAVAEQYVPLLRPDVVAVMLYLGNDINTDLEPLLPHHPPWFVTNAGWLRAFDRLMQPLTTPEQAYDYYRRLGNRIGVDPRGPWLDPLRSLLTTTAVGGLCWASLAERGPPPAEEDPAAQEQRSRAKMERALIVRDCLQRIRAAAEAAECRFRLFLIPVRPTLRNAANRTEGNLLLFRGFDPRFPTDLEEGDYAAAPDLHLDNRGHAKFATFVLDQLRRDLAGR